MIIEWLMDVFAGVAVWFFGLFPADEDLVSFSTDARGAIQGVFDAADGLGAWIDWGFLLLVFGLVTGLWLLGLVIKAVRWLVGLIPTMGGG